MAGCDSTTTLNLTINNSSTSTSTVVECDTYTWNGTTYTSSGSYTWVGTNAWDVIVQFTLNLTINSSSVYTNNQLLCSGDSYTINGNTYTSGTYTDVLTSVNGCDSTVVTVITISTVVSVSVTPSGPVSICDGLTSTLSSSVTNTNYTYQWSDANGVIVGSYFNYI